MVSVPIPVECSSRDFNCLCVLALPPKTDSISVLENFIFFNPCGHHFTSDFKNTTIEYPVSPSDIFQVSGGNLRSTVIWTHCDFRRVRSNFLLLHVVGVKAFSWSCAQLPRSFSRMHEAEGLSQVECCSSSSPVSWQVLPVGTSAWISLCWSMSLLPYLQRSTHYCYLLN